MPAGFELETPQIEPTVCGPVSDFRELTTNANAYQLGWFGFVAGFITCALFVVGLVYGPVLVARWRCR